MATTSSEARVKAEQPRIERKDRRERTRERFINAALELLRTEGVQGVTVSQVSKRIEVHHTLFYAHFEDVSACLAAAAERVITTLAPVDRELRRDLLRRAVTDRRALARYFEGAFERWMSERACVELLLAHRLDRSALGETLRPALASMRDDLATDLWDLASQVGVAGKFLPEVRAHADLLVGHWLWALEMLIEGRAQDRSVLAEMLADVMISANMRFLDSARRPSREHAIAAAYSAETREQLCATRARLMETLASHDDAWIIERSGGSEVMLRRVLEGTCKFFLPAVAGPARARVRYRVTAPDRSEPIELELVMQEGTCQVETAKKDVAPTLVLAMSFRTALETITRARHFDQAFRAGDLRIPEGDLHTALAWLDWFDYYE